MAKRKIIKIDEGKCTGCGLCIPNCPEGAIQIIDGKARIIRDLFCDGLGACLGHCPEGAITIEEREAEPFDPSTKLRVDPERRRGIDEKKAVAHHHHIGGGCPGSKVMDLRRQGGGKKALTGQSSELRQWPIQIALVPPRAPYLEKTDLLISADCVPFAYADFHGGLLKDKVILIGCPKLDDSDFYKEKISQIVKDNDIRSITYAHMEVPCCFGFISIIKSAIAGSGKNIPFKEVVISINGEKLK